MKNLWLDLRYALRQLRKNPGFAATAAITLALGIAATSTIFSWVQSTLFNPVPGVAHTGGMITIQRGERSEHAAPPLSYDDFVDLRTHATSLSGLLGYHDDFMALTGAGMPVRIYGALTSTNYFEVLGVHLILGRTFGQSNFNERDGAPEAILSYALWQNRFGSDPGIVGKAIQVNLHSFTVVGVAPRGFEGCKSGLRTDIWFPLGMDNQIWGGDRINNRGVSWLNVLGVLRPGVDPRQAENELNVIMEGIAQRYPDSHRGNNLLSIDPLWRSPFGVNVYLAGTLPILLALAGVLLILACANVANLLLVRSISRRRECAIRLAMGAGRWTLARQFLIENLLVALAGGAIALTVTYWTASTLGTFLPSVSLPIDINGHVDLTVMLATFAVSVATAVISGIVPALRATALAPVTVLKDEGLNASASIHKSRLTSALVSAQIALSLVLLVCAGLFVRSLNKAQSSDPGFNPHNVYLASLDLDPLNYPEAKEIEFEREVLDRVRALPGVRSAALADFSPLSFTIHSRGVLPEGYVPQPHESIEVDRGDVSAGYLQTLRTPLVAGREFTSADNLNSVMVAMVNQALVDRYWPGLNAIGKHIQDGSRTYTVVGVVANAKYRRLVREAAPLILYPLGQRPDGDVILHVRVAGDPMSFAPSIERAIHGLEPNLPLYGVTTLEHNMWIGNVFERIAVVLASAFGLVAMLLAAVGVYGVVSYTARQRTHEIGIRMALGAGRGDVFRQTLRQGLRLTLIGVAAGVVASLACAQFLRGMLYGVAVTDGLTFAAVAAALALVALAACLIPAGRAASVDPMQALRTE
ncbi:MAG TPA: ABC transporter permease [Terracidiphilus sp.]|nr:ABC transporter permease [Terracidiphilus sp.]